MDVEELESLVEPPIGRTVRLRPHRPATLAAVSPKIETFGDTFSDGEDEPPRGRPPMQNGAPRSLSYDDDRYAPGPCEERCRLVSLCVILTLLAATIIAGVTAPWWLPYPPECTLPAGGIQVRARADPPPPRQRKPIAVPSVFLFDDSEKWERDWLTTLGLTPDLRVDRLAAPELWPPSVVIVAPRSVAGTPFERTLRALRAALATGAVRRFGLVHLGDEEGLTGPTPSSLSSLYNHSACAWVLRNYWYPTSANGGGGNVSFLPLGAKSGFAAVARASSGGTTRDLIWAFAGSHKSDRLEAVKELLPLRPNKAHWIAEWQLVFRLPHDEYVRLLQRALFAPAPPGDHNIDAFRVYEALEAGTLPIALAYTPAQPAGGDYWTGLLGRGHPVISVGSWYEAGHAICALIRDPPRLRRALADADAWWAAKKEELRDRVDALRGDLLL